jgi:hypothetical protein
VPGFPDTRLPRLFGVFGEKERQRMAWSKTVFRRHWVSLLLLSLMTGTRLSGSKKATITGTIEEKS